MLIFFSVFINGKLCKIEIENSQYIVMLYYSYGMYTIALAYMIWRRFPVSHWKLYKHVSQFLGSTFVAF